MKPFKDRQGLPLTNKLVPDADPVRKSGRGDDEAVDEGHQRCLVVRGGCILQLLHHHTEAVPLAFQRLENKDGDYTVNDK